MEKPTAFHGGLCQWLVNAFNRFTDSKTSGVGSCYIFVFWFKDAFNNSISFT